MYEKEAEEYAEKVYGLEGSLCTNIQEQACAIGFRAGAGYVYKELNKWHNIDEEPIPTDSGWDNEFVIRLKNGNRRIVYSSCGRLKDRINGEHIPTDVIKLWLQLPKEN